ncbi:MAG: hypothetical protein E7221_01130 [Clostridiales bacterium]|nr:hypothetical protein [Clostridiales bacterium]
MFSEELLEESRQSAEKAQQKLGHISDQPTGITGGDSAAGHTVTRTAMRKNADHISKSIHIDKILAFIAKVSGKSSEQYGIIPHPLAWDLCFDGETVYAHTIDGPEVECVFEDPEKNAAKKYCVYRLVVDGNHLINQETSVALTANKKHKMVGVIAIIAVILFFAILILPAYL